MAGSQTSKIGSTRFDLYKWTFTKRKRQKGDGWSVAIPDGFVVKNSKEGRVFEAFPTGREKDHIPSVHIMPGMIIPSPIGKELWMYHPYARAGIAGFFAVEAAKLSAGVMGAAPEIYLSGFSDVCAYMFVMNTGGKSYSFQSTILNDKTGCNLRVQTGSITDAQKNSLIKSVMEWLQTFKYDKSNESIPKEPMIEAPAVLNNLKKGITSRFDESVDMILKEYGVAIKGRILVIEFMDAYGLIGNKTSNMVKDVLSQAMELKEFYCIKADELIGKLKEQKSKNDVLRKVYKKLNDLEESTTEIEVNGKKVKITEPSRIKEIRGNWKKEIAGLATAGTKGDKSKGIKKELDDYKAIEIVKSDIHFFLKYEVIEKLQNMDDAISISQAVNASFDIYDQLFRCWLYADDKGLSLRIYIRNEFGINSEDEDIGIYFDAKGNALPVKVKGTIAGDAGILATNLLKATIKLYKSAVDQGVLKEYGEMNTDVEGVMVKLAGNKLSFSRISGKQRPSMPCLNLFGEMEQKRPYADEAAEAMLLESMSFEERLEAAEKGVVSAMGSIAESYLNGDDVEQDSKKAVEWFKKQAETGDPTGQYNLAIQYLKGDGVKQNYEQAYEWIKKSEENGDPDAPELVQKCAEIVSLQKKAESNDSKAAGQLASILMEMSSAFDDRTAVRFHKESVKYANLAADSGNAEGMWILGLAYEHGRGVGKNHKKAIDYFKNGADKGNSSCMHNLGCMYIQGDTVKEDKKKGFTLCLKAAEKGNSKAARTVGTCYLHGYGTEESIRKAVKWFEKYLEDNDDPEVARKVALFKTLPDYVAEEDEDMSPKQKKETTARKKKFFSRKIFVLSGFDSFTEPPIRKQIEDNGGVVKSTTVLDTDILIFHDQLGVGTKKYERALELNRTKGKKIEMIPLSEFSRMLEEFNNPKKAKAKITPDTIKKENEISRLLWEGTPQGNISLESFEVTDDLDALHTFVKAFKQSWKNELESSNEEILHEKDEPVSRSNDYRIKKIAKNSESIISKYAYKLQEVMVKLDQIAQEKKSAGVQEKELKDVYNLIATCYDELHMEVKLKFAKAEVKYKYSIVSKYVNLSRKWKKEYKALPSVKAQEIRRSITEKNTELDSLKKQISSEKRKRTLLGKSIEESDEDLKKIRSAYEKAMQAYDEKKVQYDADASSVSSEITRLDFALEETEEKISTLKKAISEKENMYHASIASDEKKCRDQEQMLQNLLNERELIAEDELQKRTKSEGAFFFKKKKLQEHEEAFQRLTEKDGQITACRDVLKQYYNLLNQTKEKRDREISSLNEQLAPWKDKKPALQQARSAAEDKRKSLDNEIQRFETKFKAKEKELRNVKEKSERLKNQYEDIDKGIAETESRRDVIQNEIAMAEKQLEEIVHNNEIAVEEHLADDEKQVGQIMIDNDTLTGLKNIADYFQSGEENLSTQSTPLTGLESEIVEWFRKEDTLHPFKEIQTHFSKKSKAEIKKALDNLSEKGVIYGGENIVGNMYGLA